MSLNYSGDLILRAKELRKTATPRNGIYGMTFFPVIRCGFSGKKP